MLSAVKLLAMDKTVILYRPQFNKFTGSPLATILLNQIIYWWDKAGNKPFYKFKEPCAHRLYREGDSWCEELGFSKRNFESSVKALVEADLITHRVDNARLTWYSINVEKLGEALISLTTSKEEKTTELNENDSVNTETIFTVNTETHFTVNPETVFTSIYKDYSETTQENASLESQKKSFENLQGKNILEEQDKEMKIQTGNTALLEQLKEKMPVKRKGGGNVNALAIRWKQLRAEWLPNYQGNLTGKETGFLKLLLKDFGADAEGMLSYAVSKWAIFAEKACQATGSSDRPTQPQLGFITQNRSILGELYFAKAQQPTPPVQTAPTQPVSGDVDLFEALK